MGKVSHNANTSILPDKDFAKERMFPDPSITINEPSAARFDVVEKARNFLPGDVGTAANLKICFPVSGFIHDRVAALIVM